MSPDTGVDEDPSLAGASYKAVSALLQRRHKRHKGAAGPKSAAPTAAACGAFAAAGRDDPGPSFPRPFDNDIDTGSETAGLDWEEVEDDLEVKAGSETKAGSESKDGSEPGAWTVRLEREETVAPRRKGITRADREAAQRLHRTSLLCLLGRGLLYDAAAADPMLQAAALSLLPPRIVSVVTPDQPPHLPEAKDSAAPQSPLHELAAWCARRLRPMRRGHGQQALTEADDELAATLHAAARGPGAVVEQLCVVAAQGAGSVEEVMTVCVAGLRALGWSIRSVRALYPSPLNPAAALREQAAEERGTALKPARRPSRQRAKAQGGVSDDGASGAVPSPPPGAKPRRRKARPNPVSLPSVKRESAKREETQEPEGQDDRGVATAAGRRRRGDEELERELQMAMAATAFQALPACGMGANSAAGSNQTKTPSETEPLVFKPWQADITGVLNKSMPGMGRFWLEVLCQVGPDVRWVCLDPVTGCVDRADEIRRLQGLGRRLHYVVGFAGGGAKDLTRRYTDSWVAAERSRDTGWWETTISPLRRAETRAAAGVQRGLDFPTPDGCFTGPTLHEASSTAQGPATRQEKSQLLPAEQTQFPVVVPRAPALGISLAAREDDELARRQLEHEHSVPSTQEGFRNHAMYILQRHIPRSLALRPGCKPVGRHRGEAFYARKDFGEVHTVDRWRRMGRQVLPEQLGTPAKKLPKRGSGTKAAPADSPAQGSVEEETALPGDYLKGTDVAPSSHEQSMLDDGLISMRGGDGAATSNPAACTAYYGEWQTQVAERLAVVEGRVPRNAMGNVEVPPLTWALPLGSVHLELPGIAAACSAAGVDAAPALVGFEHRAGRAVPQFRGVVIAAEFESVVLDLYWEQERAREERAEARRMAQAEAAWKLLIKATIARVRLERQYGDAAAVNAGVMQEAAAQLVHDQARVLAPETQKRERDLKRGSEENRGLVAGEDTEEI